MDPIVPAEVDLRGLPYMPLDVNRLRDSQLTISASSDEFRAAVLLWCASWNQVPAASLPDDDKTLAAYAGFGRDLKAWRRVKTGALRGFVQCSDGRFYHPVVAEKAMEAWQERLEYRDKRDNEAERMRRHREEHKSLRDQLRECGITAPWNAKIEELRATLRDVELQRNSTAPETRTGALPATAKKGREEKGRDKEQEQKTLSAGADDPSAEQPVAETPKSTIPVAAILAAYHAELPMLPAVRQMTDARKRKLKARWCEDPERQAVEYWQKFFAYVAQSDFLTGRDNRWTGCDFEWLIEFGNHLKVIEGKYENREAAA